MICNDREQLVPLSPKQACGMTGYNLRYFYQLVKDGVIPSHQLGKGRRIIIYLHELQEALPGVCSGRGASPNRTQTLVK